MKKNNKQENQQEREKKEAKRLAELQKKISQAKNSIYASLIQRGW